MVLDKKCKSCGSIVKFDPETQKMKCEHCGNTYDITPEDSEEIKNNSEYYDVYTCPDCGAKILADTNTTSTFCVYCKNTAILKDKMQGEFAPSMIIPFKKTKKEAIDAWLSLQKGRKLIPDEFLKEKNIEEIKAIYIPFWLFSEGVNGEMVCDAKRTYSTPGIGGNYLVTENYRLRRLGNIAFNRVPVDGSIHFDDSIMQSIEPFNYDNLVPYASDYLSGFFSELYDVNSEDAYKIANDRINKSSYNTFYNSMNPARYSSIVPTVSNFVSHDTKNEYVLLPVWLLNVKYNDKCYPFAMNGETGKMIGDIPYDKNKAMKKYLIYFIICLVIFLILGIIIWKVMW